MIFLSQKNSDFGLIQKLGKNQLKSPMMWIKSLQIISWLHNEHKLRRSGPGSKLFEGFYQVYVGSRSKRRRHFRGDINQDLLGGDSDEVTKLVVDQDPSQDYFPDSTSSLRNQRSIVESDHHVDIKMADYLIEKYLKALRR